LANRETVFVVDDDPSMLKSMGRLRRQLGYGTALCNGAKLRDLLALGSRRSQGRRRPASGAVIASHGLLPSLPPPTFWCGCAS
jgi:hypothetical protein